MGNAQSLTKQQKQFYQEQYDEACRKAAVAISEADIMLFAHGAGMSADSGLPVFNDIAKFEAYRNRGLTYPDICTPSWLEDEPDLFYGFWGKCYNDYMKVAPNDGYFIVKSWREKFFNGQRNQKNDHWLEKLKNNYHEQLNKTYADPPTNAALIEEIGNFFIYTSNIDSHSLKPGLFADNEVYEIHGSTERWQCSDCCSLNKWDLPDTYTFEVDMETMKSQAIGLPPCPDCEKPARPWRYSHWREAVVETANELDLKVVILEVGAGTNVPSVRIQSESFCKDITPGNCKVVRINPDFPHCGEGSSVSNHLISIMERGLPALKKINEHIEELTAE